MLALSFSGQRRTLPFACQTDMIDASKSSPLNKAPRNVGRYVTYRAIYDRLHYEGFIA